MKHPKYPTKTPVGFTIVELLIVIVIIGILASLVMMTFSGVTARANNAQRIHFAKAHLNAIKLFIQDNGRGPYNGQVCLGIGYPDLFNSDGVGDCGRIDAYQSGEYGSRSENQTFYDQLGV